MGRLRRWYRARRVLAAHKLLRANGYVCLERQHYASLRAYLWNVELRCRRLGGGNASKVRNRNKQLRRLAQRFREYLETLDRLP